MRTRWLAVLSVLVACPRSNSGPPMAPASVLDGEGDPNTPPSNLVDTETEGAAPTSVLSASAACARFETLAGGSCDWTQRFPPAFRDPANCLTSIETWLSPATPDHDKFQLTINCWSLGCDDAAACMVRAQANAAPPKPRNCGDEGTAPILVDAATWAARRGLATKRFADLKTTVDAPVEVCGIEGELAWMVAVTCNDGSNPYGTQAAAHEGRDAWFERGGRCNSVLDRYAVACPEAIYQVHVDRYVCPQP